MSWDTKYYNLEEVRTLLHKNSSKLGLGFNEEDISKIYRREKDFETNALYQEYRISFPSDYEFIIEAFKELKTVEFYADQVNRYLYGLAATTLEEYYIKYPIGTLKLEPRRFRKNTIMPIIEEFKQVYLDSCREDSYEDLIYSKTNKVDYEAYEISLLCFLQSINIGIPKSELLEYFPSIIHSVLSSDIPNIEPISDSQKYPCCLDKPKLGNDFNLFINEANELYEFSPIKRRKSSIKTYENHLKTIRGNGRLFNFRTDGEIDYDKIKRLKVKFKRSFSSILNVGFFDEFDAFRNDPEKYLKS